MAETPDFWQHLKQYTSARIALGKAGNSITTSQLLDFQLAHARARDAVQAELDFLRIEKKLAKFNLPVLILSSKATDRRMYLQRPDLGRTLNDVSVSQIDSLQKADYDISLVIADGLSSFAIEKNIEPLLDELVPKLTAHPFKLSPLNIVRQGRVAIGDQIGYLLNSRMVIVFIGERPGLSSPDSLGIYLTYQPKMNLTDEMRNCISNVHPNGLPYSFAAEKLYYLIKEAFIRKLSGVNLKDDLDLRLENKKSLDI